MSGELVSNWEQRYWAAYEWAHNEHHPNGHKIALFARAYANANNGTEVPEAFCGYWAKWVDGKQQPEMETDWW